MKKIYLIGGPSRCGKSIVRKRFTKQFKISGISTNSLAALLDDNDILNEVSWTNNLDQKAKKMWPYLKSFIEHEIKYREDSIVIEGDILLPEYLNEFSGNNLIVSCCLGYPNVDINKKIADIKKYDAEKKYDWIKNTSTELLAEFVQDNINNSKKIENESLNYGISFFDLSDSANFKCDINEVINKLLFMNN